MSPKLLRYVLAMVYLSLAIGLRNNDRELRVVHKLVGGHLSVQDGNDEAELITSSAGAGRESKKKKGDEEKKTLSQQVADGKYGLIQTEIFSKPVKRPGIISYTGNGEIPEDNDKNFGGLNKNDIWLSENHLLVIKGGTYPPHTERPSVNSGPIWPPIDDYRAPHRQVKIPKHPKVPPPFPVQLTENGPLLLLGTNASTTLNGTYGSELYPLYSPENYVSEDGFPLNELPYPYPANATPGEAPFPISHGTPDNLAEYNSTDGFPPSINRSVLPLYPFLGPEEPLPPLQNITNQYDEDDMSLYYPPPYSFYYAKDNTSRVPAGPLVPGIVLPPPPDFFAPLDDDMTTIKSGKPITMTIESTTTTTKEKSDNKQINSILDFEKPQPPTIIEPTHSPVTRKPQVSNPRRKNPTVTILKPITENPPIYDPNDLQSPLKAYSPPATKSRTIISTTQVPLKAYYTTTYKLTPLVVTQKPNRTYLPSGILTTKFPKTTTKLPAQYYFYEDNDINTTPKQRQRQQYYNTPRESYVPIKQEIRQPQPSFSKEQNIQYYYINGENVFNNYQQTHPPIRTTNRPDSFSIHIARLKNQIHSHQPLPQNYYRPQVPLSKPVYQYSFQAANYPNRHETYQSPLRHYQVQIQEAVEVTTPVYETSQKNFYYQSPVTENPARYRESYQGNSNLNQGIPKALSQYSFEATQNPIYQQFYTKQEEKYIDDVTKQHFTVFGKKLPAGTTPIPHADLPDYAEPKPAELERDTIINYLQPQRSINPHAEYRDPEQYNIEYRPAQPIFNSYVPQRQSIPQNSNPNFRFAGQASTDNDDERKPYVTYKLPGDDGTHFYFITPQLAQKREQNSSFFFSRSNASRSREADRSRFNK